MALRRLTRATSLLVTALAATPSRAVVKSVLRTPERPMPIRWESCDPTGTQVKLSRSATGHPDGGAPVLVELTDAPDAPRDAEDIEAMLVRGAKKKKRA